MMRDNDAKLEQIISDLKSEFKEKLIKIYVVKNENSNIDSNLIADPLIYSLKVHDLDFTHHLTTKLTPETKIVLIEKNSFLYEYVMSKNGVLEYKPVKCFEACADMQNYLKLMLQFFEYEMNQLHFFIFRLYFDSFDKYLETIKKENKEFSSYTVFMDHSISEKAIIYGRYLSKDNVQTLLRLKKCVSLNEIESNTFNFKVSKAIPSFRVIDTFKPQTRLMGIDLGANTIVVCVSRDGHPELIKIDREYSMPSYNATEYQFDLNNGNYVNQAVITVPDFENELMLDNIYAAAESVGLNITDVITGKRLVQ
uniref:Uncharacterized protein n=1 Tax=Panagrolaimus sp. JU765 TaxID=591449 RepID=A0AC34QBC2_9BILA